MKNDRCQNNCCQSGSCSMSSFMETFYPAAEKGGCKSLEDGGQARACSLPEVASLVELTLIGSMTKEQAVLAADPYSIGAMLREPEAVLAQPEDLGAPERLLIWSDEARSLKMMAENVAYPLEQSDLLSGTEGLLLLQEDRWLGSGHLKELFEEWALQYDSDRYGSASQPSIALRERLLYRWKGHMETMLYHLDEGTLSVALVSGIDMPWAHAQEPAYLADLRDIQLEALFRASLACYRQGMEHRLEILVPYPVYMEEWNDMHDLIEKVAEETLCHQRRAVSYSIGALVQTDIHPGFAADLARCADLIVLDSSGMSCAERSWSAEGVEGFETLVECIRKVRSQLPLRVSGLMHADNLPSIYRVHVKEVGVLPETIPAFRLAAAQWELREQGRSKKIVL